MPTRRFTFAALALAGVCAASSGHAAPEPSVPQPPSVVVSIAPLQGLIQPLATAFSRAAAVEVLIPPGVSEHGYEPTPQQLAAAARADLIVLVGLGLEARVEQFLNEHPVAPSGRGVRRVLIVADVLGVGAAESPATTDHEHTDDCDHGHTDPHLWLDPTLAAKLVERVAAELERIARARGDGLPVVDAIVTAREQLTKNLADLDAEYARRLLPHKGKTVLVAHDAYGWLARRYGLTFVALAGLNAGEPTPGALAEAAQAVKGLALTSVYVEPQLSPAAVQRIAAATGTSVRTLDPLGTGDYVAFMRKNLDALVAGFEPRAAPAGEPAPEPAGAPR
ncbi:MAG: metal ABC transporter substrate-binding protein [Phycisphaerales bacterium]